MAGENLWKHGYMNNKSGPYFFGENTWTQS